MIIWPPWVVLLLLAQNVSHPLNEYVSLHSSVAVSLCYIQPEFLCWHLILPKKLLWVFLSSWGVTGLEITLPTNFWGVIYPCSSDTCTVVQGGHYQICVVFRNVHSYRFPDTFKFYKEVSDLPGIATKHYEQIKHHKNLLEINHFPHFNAFMRQMFNVEKETVSKF